MAMPQARMGDTTDHGGKIITGAMRTTVNGRPVARMGDFVLCPKDNHGLTTIVTGSQQVMVEGKPAAGMGDTTSCGATIITGSLDTFI